MVSIQSQQVKQLFATSTNWAAGSSLWNMSSGSVQCATWCRETGLKKHVPQSHRVSKNAIDGEGRENRSAVIHGSLASFFNQISPWSPGLSTNKNKLNTLNQNYQMHVHSNARSLVNHFVSVQSQCECGLLAFSLH